ncbi:MAG: hypothetical protein OEV44_11695, partial [Spirochaetota bacterium]|nr:hypothetical protein [Spirochaetota bacterium]
MKNIYSSIKRKRIDKSVDSANNVKYSKLVNLLWLVPIGLSAFLFYRSPNLIKEIHKDQDAIIKQEKISNILNEVRKEQAISKMRFNNTKSSSDITENEVSIFYCELIDSRVKLVPKKVLISPEQDKIHQIIDKLVQKPSYLDEKYQSLMPKGTKLINYRIS